MDFYRKFFILALIIGGGVFFCINFLPRSALAEDVTSTVTITQETTPPPPGVGGRPSFGETKAVVKGFAYPAAKVHLLLDGREATSDLADAAAAWQLEINSMTPGIYTFSLWAEDTFGRKSLTLSYTLNVIANAVTTISPVFIPPTVAIDKASLTPEESLAATGQTVPGSDVIVLVNSDEVTFMTKADSLGNWRQLVAANSLEPGQHLLKAKSTLADGNKSAFSSALIFYIQAASAPEESVPARRFRPGDFNKDDHVDIVDFSIMLFWWDKVNPEIDLNNSGRVDLADFSIMLYYWTG